MMHSRPADPVRYACQTQVGDFAHAAYRALLVEVNLTPKPGLVDRHNNGAHRDMNLGHFYRSARAIGIWLPRFIRQGRDDAFRPAVEQLLRLRPLGLACENHMFQATGGVNTHKGSVFSLGLLCAAFGRRYQQQRHIDAKTLCSEVARMCDGLVARELQQHNALQTAGQRLFAEHGLSGARGEAESGFERVINGALPLYRQRLNAGCDEQTALMDSLLWLMAHNDDTNVASRGGIEGLHWLQQRAAGLLAQGGAQGEQGIQRLRQFDADCIMRNLSPGGSADLLIVTWLLAQLPN
ncbi:triphosphoribosyl-dephospho-CoA synthase CitG [Serratia proteamaculans]|uniref:Probable 2-(5''-triphosphoribosyl)-3'-dephosphocoenzyme-A synthase n=1 Tax=Serratia proteamaculans TaxID=28151 RepID=A0A5Q2VG21_SERPR|nr:triphosphoribosyl-dephospho-CoA synthase CitG [Serratia proteamaculans]QGH62969.1 triphosphoribosyl-dephospho-CoA synthase CitG [Serratia proteamaculans]